LRKSDCSNSARIVDGVETGAGGEAGGVSVRMGGADFADEGRRSEPEAPGAAAKDGGPCLLPGGLL